MKNANRPVWYKYKVGEPSTRSNWTNPDCCPFDSVHHICHTADAYRMLEDGKIRSSLIWDESCLNNTRTCVAWLSPNHWSYGSLYGNVEFRYDWRSLVDGKQFYWVEAIDKYNPPAFRILITDKEEFSDLEPYPVDQGDGPLYLDRSADIWYWNGNFTGEFMIDEDLSLRDCTGIRFCGHHPSLCRKDGGSCAELGQRWDKAAVKLLSLAIGTKVIRSTSRNRKLFMENDGLQSETEGCLVDILFKARKCSCDGSVEASDKAALPLAAAILERLGREQDIAALAGLFKDGDNLEQSLRKRMANAFDLDLPEFPGTEDEE